MLAPTHSIFSLFLTLILLAVFGVKEGLHWTILLTAVIGSFMPDIDMPKSVVGRIFFFISIPLERKFGHRTVTHSLIGWAVFSIAFMLIAGLLFFVLNHFSLNDAVANFMDIPLQDRHHHFLRLSAAFSIGYMSHVILDMFNPRGVQLFWPNSGRDVIPGNVRFRPESGSKTEIGIFLFLVLLLIPAFPISKYGTLTTLRWLLATPEAVIEEFKQSRTRTLVEFEGVFEHSKLSVSGTAEVLDIHLGKLIIWHNQTTYTLSDEMTADIMAFKTRAIKTDYPISIRHYPFSKMTVTDLLNEITDTDLVSGVVVLPPGLTLDIPFTVRDAAPILQVKDRLTLTFATKSELKALKFDDAFTKHQTAIKTKISLLTQTRKKLSAQLRTLDDTDNDLTDLGKQMLGKSSDSVTQKKEAIQAQLESTDETLETLKSELSDKPFTFSGEVWIRDVRPLREEEKI